MQDLGTGRDYIMSVEFFVILRMATTGSNNIKPNFPKRLFWEYDFGKIDWKKHAEAVIDRIIERGTHEHWNELIRFYGKRKVTNNIKNKITHLPDEIIKEVCQFFNLKPGDLKCYIRKQSNRGHWN